MNRRCFVGSSLLISAASLSAAVPQNPPPPPKPGAGATPPPPSTAPAPARGVRITVLERSVRKDLQKYATLEMGEIPACGVLKDNQQFTFDFPTVTPPAGFCAWAWDDLRKSVYSVYIGRPERMVACCSDGYRPVFFLLERLV